MKEEKDQMDGKLTTLVIGVDDKLSFGQNLLYGIQHVFVLMMAPLITPIIFASVFGWDTSIVAYLIMIMITGAGIETAIQAKVLKLPVAQAQHLAFIAVMIPALFQYGPVMVWIGLVIVSAITIFLVIPFKKGLLGTIFRYIATPAVIGPLFIIMALALARPAVIDLIFPNYGQGVIIDGGNVILAGIAILIPVLITLLRPKGILRFGCILWGLLAATIVAIFMGKLDFAAIKAAPWFQAPRVFSTVFKGNMGIPLNFDWGFIIVVITLFIAEMSNLLDTVGVYKATAGLVGQELKRDRINRGLFVETSASLITTVFGNIPCTSFGQNLGILSLSRVGAKSIIFYGGVIMIIVGVVHKFAAFFAAIPWAIYGGIMFVILGSILMVGIQMISSMEQTETKKLIAGLSTTVGIFLLLMPPEIAASLPRVLRSLAENPIGSTVIVAIILNLIFVVGLKSPGK